MGYKGSITFLILSTAMILVPIAGSIFYLFQLFIKILNSGKESNLDKKETKKISKLIIIAFGITYGLSLEGLFIWIIWISQFETSQFIKLFGLFMSMPYFIALFSIYYSLGSAIAFGGYSLNHFIGQVFKKK